nr:EOG090X0BAY [Lepidurus arcticus]
MEDKPEEFYLTYQRFYYDPPEFQTVVLYGDLKLGQHLGYFRDDPKEMPAFLASNTESKGCTITPMGPNLFSALNTVLNEAICKDISKKSALKSLQTKLADWAKTHGFDLQPKNAEMKVRNSKSLAKTFHGAGMVVPYNKKTQLGYREIPETNANLKKILAKIVESETDDERDSNFDPLQEIITNVQFANDEGDPGMGLELGLDLFCYGGESLHSTLLHLFPVAYDLLNRPLYTRIIKVGEKPRSTFGQSSQTSLTYAKY